jgi:hypothetical protein
MKRKSGELWAITTCFSPVRDLSRIENYRRFRAALDVPLATIEIGLDGHWDLTEEDADLYVRIRDADMLWQKERLLNLLLTRLPADCRYVAWLDGDVLLMDPGWWRNAIDALSTDSLVQLFSSLSYLGRDGRQDGDQRQSVAAAVMDGSQPAALLAGVTKRTGNAASPGMAWAARRELLERHGFYDTCIIGGGDTALACAAWGVPEVAMRLHHMNLRQRERYGEWAAGFHRDVGARVGALTGELRHLWHGDLAARRAAQRHVDLSAHDFDPSLDIAPGTDGAWRWSSDKPLLHALLQEYFSGRSRHSPGRLADARISCAEWAAST